MTRIFHEKAPQVLTETDSKYEKAPQVLTETDSKLMSCLAQTTPWKLVKPGTKHRIGEGKVICTIFEN